MKLNLLLKRRWRLHDHMRVSRRFHSTQATTTPTRTTGTSSTTSTRSQRAGVRLPTPSPRRGHHAQVIRHQIRTEYKVQFPYLYTSRPRAVALAPYHHPPLYYVKPDDPDLPAFYFDPARCGVRRRARLHETRSRVVSLSSLSCFGPRRGRRGVSETAVRLHETAPPRRHRRDPTRVSVVLGTPPTRRR